MGWLEDQQKAKNDLDRKRKAYRGWADELKNGDFYRVLANVIDKINSTTNIRLEMTTEDRISASTVGKYEIQGFVIRIAQSIATLYVSFPFDFDKSQAEGPVFCTYYYYRRPSAVKRMTVKINTVTERDIMEWIEILMKEWS